MLAVHTEGVPMNILKVLAIASALALCGCAAQAPRDIETASLPAAVLTPDVTVASAPDANLVVCKADGSLLVSPLVSDVIRAHPDIVLGLLRACAKRS